MQGRWVDQFGFLLWFGKQTNGCILLRVTITLLKNSPPYWTIICSGYLPHELEAGVPEQKINLPYLEEYFFPCDTMAGILLVLCRVCITCR